MGDKDKRLNLIQFIKFGLVGAFNTVLNYVIYSVCYHLLHTNVHVANITGFVLSVFSAFMLQSRFVFKESDAGERRIWWQVLIKTYISYAFTGLFLTEVLLVLWLHIIDISQYMGVVSVWLSNMGLSMPPKDIAVSVAPILNMVFTIPINFCVNKFWAYRQKRS